MGSYPWPVELPLEVDGGNGLSRGILSRPLEFGFQQSTETGRHGFGGSCHYLFRITERIEKAVKCGTACLSSPGCSIYLVLLIDT